jgi:hypothetical protein
MSEPFSISPTPKTIYGNLPPPNTDGAPQGASDTSPAPFATLAAATAAEHGLAPGYLTQSTAGYCEPDELKGSRPVRGERNVRLRRATRPTAAKVTSGRV